MLTPLKKEITTVPDVKQGPSLLQTMKEGASFGMGATLARVMIERTILPPSRIEFEPCYIEKRVFERCLLNNDESVYCRHERDNYDECIKVTEKSGRT